MIHLGEFEKIVILLILPAVGPLHSCQNPAFGMRHQSWSRHKTPVWCLCKDVAAPSIKSTISIMNIIEKMGVMLLMAMISGVMTMETMRAVVRMISNQLLGSLRQRPSTSGLGVLLGFGARSHGAPRVFWDWRKIIIQPEFWISVNNLGCRNMPLVWRINAWCLPLNMGVYGLLTAGSPITHDIKPPCWQSTSLVTFTWVDPMEMYSPML